MLFRNTYKCICIIDDEYYHPKLSTHDYGQIATVSLHFNAVSLHSVAGCVPDFNTVSLHSVAGCVPDFNTVSLHSVAGCVPDFNVFLMFSN